MMDLKGGWYERFGSVECLGWGRVQVCYMLTWKCFYEMYHVCWKYANLEIVFNGEYTSSVMVWTNYTFCGSFEIPQNIMWYKEILYIHYMFYFTMLSFYLGNVVNYHLPLF